MLGVYVWYVMWGIMPNVWSMYAFSSLPRFITLSYKSHRLLGYIVPNLLVYVLARVGKGKAFAHSMPCVYVCVSCFSRAFSLVSRVAICVYPKCVRIRIVSAREWYKVWCVSAYSVVVCE